MCADRNLYGYINGTQKNIMTLKCQIRLTWHLVAMATLVVIMK